MGRAGNFISELFRRKVVRLLCAYVAIFWLLAQGFTSIFPALGIPDVFLRLFVIVGIAAIPVFAFISWKYDVVPPQLVRDSGDVSSANPMLAWAIRRHDNADAGHLILKWESADGRHQEQRFSTPVSVGRVSENHVQLNDRFVSRFHVLFWAEDGSWRIRDLDSTNGTFIEGSRVDRSAVLPESCELRFHLEGPALRVEIDKPEETAVYSEQ